MADSLITCKKELHFRCDEERMCLILGEYHKKIMIISKLKMMILNLISGRVLRSFPNNFDDFNSIAMNAILLQNGTLVCAVTNGDISIINLYTSQIKQSLKIHSTHTTFWP